MNEPEEEGKIPEEKPEAGNDSEGAAEASKTQDDAIEAGNNSEEQSEDATAGETSEEVASEDDTSADAADDTAEDADDAEPEKPDVVEALFDAPPLGELERMVEAILFASSEPLTRPQIEERLPHGSDAAAAVESLRKRYEGRGVALVRIGPAWAFRTAPDLGHLMRREAQETRKLSRAAIETLAIIAYHQPTTRAEIEEIRGVSVSRGTLDLLLELDWIKLGRRRETPGRPVTFVTTAEFLDHFGLESARDLPGLKELRAAGLLDNRPPPGEALSLEDDGPQGEDEETEDMFPEDGANPPSENQSEDAQVEEAPAPEATSSDEGETGSDEAPRSA